MCTAKWDESTVTQDTAVSKTTERTSAEVQELYIPQSAQMVNLSNVPTPQVLEDKIAATAHQKGLLEAEKKTKKEKSKRREKKEVKELKKRIYDQKKTCPIRIRRAFLAMAPVGMISMERRAGRGSVRSLARQSRIDSSTSSCRSAKLLWKAC